MKEEVEPIYGSTYLPRKFKIAVAVPPHNDVDVNGNDSSFVAIAKDGELVSYNVLVGGGMGCSHSTPGTYPQIAKNLGFKPFLIRFCRHSRSCRHHPTR